MPRNQKTLKVVGTRQENYFCDYQPLHIERNMGKPANIETGETGLQTAKFGQKSPKFVLLH